MQKQSLNIHIHVLYVTTWNAVGNLILTVYKGQASG